MRARALRWEANAFVGFMERQKNLYRRYWAWELVWFVYSVVSVMSIGYLASGLASLGVEASAVSLQQAQLYLLVGALLWSYLSLVFFEVAFAIGWERWEGTIEYTFMAPVRRLTHLLGICAFSLIYGLGRTLLVGLIVVVTFGLDLSRADLPGALAVLIVATVPLVGLGILCSILPLLAPEKGVQMTIGIQGLLLLVSGVYYPLSVLPAPVRVVGEISPLTYTLLGMREALLQGSSTITLLPTLGLLLVMGLILVPLALSGFASAEARAKRLGLLKRSG